MEKPLRHSLPEIVFTDLLPTNAGEIIRARQAAEAMQAWLARYQPGSTFETIKELYSDDEGFNQWKFTATSLDGVGVVLQGVEYFRFPKERLQ